MSTWPIPMASQLCWAWMSSTTTAPPNTAPPNTVPTISAHAAARDASGVGSRLRAAP